MNRLSGIVVVIAVMILAPATLRADVGLVNGWFFADKASPDYEVGTGRAPGETGKPSAFLRAKSPNPAKSGVFMQMIRADAYVGKRMRLRVRLKTIDAGTAFVWMGTMDSFSHVMLGGDNGAGTTDWQQYDVVTDVTEKSTTLQFGVTLQGKGAVWMDSFSLDEVSKDVPVTRSPQLGAPVNTQFDP